MGRRGWSDPEKARTMTCRIPLGRFAGQSLSFAKVTSFAVVTWSELIRSRQWRHRYVWLVVKGRRTFSNHRLPSTTCGAAVLHCLLPFSPCDLTEVCFLQRWRMSWTASCSCWATRAAWRTESACRWTEASWPAERSTDPLRATTAPSHRLAALRNWSLASHTRRIRRCLTHRVYR